MHSWAGALLSSVCSGVLLALSFPNAGHPLVAWVALVPLLVAVSLEPVPRRAFGLGLVTGLVHFVGTLYWITQVMVEYGGLALTVAWGVHALLVGYLALYPALFALIISVMCRRLGPVGLLYAPAVWVTTELGRIYLFTGFPWELLGYSQTPVLPIAQVASVVGVLGLSTLVALVNGAVAFAVTTEGPRRWRVLGAAVVLVLASAAFGGWRIQTGTLQDAGTPLRVATVQGNIAQSDKWDPALRDSILTTYVELTRRAARQGAQLIIWPEAATPFAFESDGVRSNAVRALARETGAHLLIGSTAISRDVDVRYYNAAVMIDDRGGTVGVYHKQHLVPFGEYVPLRRLLFFVSPLVEAIGDFSAGTGPHTLPLDGHTVSTAICYEIIYPELVRALVIKGSHLLTTVTNDAWYGRTAAPYQHFQQATMRAIEQGRYLVRAANTGISGVIDPYGRVMVSTPLFETHVITADVRLLEDFTLYARVGDVLAYACAGLTGAVLWVTGRRRRGGAIQHMEAGCDSSS